MGVRGVPADLVIDRFHGESRCAAGHDDRRNLFLGIRSGSGGPGNRSDGDQRCDVGARVGDKLLGAVDDPLVTFETRRGAGAACVRSRSRLGETKTGERTARRQVGQPLLFLLLGTEPVDRHRTQAHRGLQRDRYRLVNLAQLLKYQRQREVVAAHAAVLLRKRQPEQAHLSHLGDNFVWEAVFRIVFGRYRRDHGARKIGHRIPKILVFLG